MPESADLSSLGNLGEVIKQHLTVLSHDIKNLQESVRTIEGRLTGLAERADIAKLEVQLDRMSAEKLLLVRKEEFADVKAQVAVLTLDKDFINEAKGTFAMIKWIAASTGALFLLLLGAGITLHQTDVMAAYETATRVAKFESRSVALDTQVAQLLDFKKEIEEQGSPILRATIKEVSQLRDEMKEERAEVKALVNVFRNRDRPDIEDSKR